MVDSIGAKPVTAVDRRVSPVSTNVAAPTSPVAQVSPVAPVSPAASATTASNAAASAAAVSRSLSGPPPVDTERVSRIRSAIARGTYPITPETIADRLIALKLEWKPHESS